MATPHQKNCVQCTQLIPLTAVHCVFCGATQPAKPQSPDAMKTVMGMPAMRLPTPVPTSVGGAAAPGGGAKPGAGAGAKPGAPAVKPVPGAAPAAAKPGSGPIAAPAAGGQGFTPVGRAQPSGSAAPVIAAEEPQQHKPTLLGMTASDVEAHIASRGSTGSSSYTVEQVEPSNSIKKTIVGGIPSPLLGAPPIMGGAAASGAPSVKKTVAMSAPVAKSAGATPAGAGTGSAKITAPKPPPPSGPGIPDDAPTMIDSSEPDLPAANIIGTPAAAGLDGVEGPDSRSSTQSNMKVSSVDQRLKAAAPGTPGAAAGGALDDDEQTEAEATPLGATVGDKADGKDAAGDKPGGDDAGAPKILTGAEAAADAPDSAKVAPTPTPAATAPAGGTAAREKAGRPQWTGGSIRIGAIVFGVLLIGGFLAPYSSGGEMSFEWDALAGGITFWKLVPFLAPLAGLVGLVVGFLKIPAAGRGFALFLLGAAGVGLHCASVIANGGPDAGAGPLFLVVPWTINGAILLGGLLLAPAGLVARAMSTGSLPARILAALGAVAILASYLAPISGDMPVLSAIEGLGEAPLVSIMLLLPALLALMSLAAFAPATTRAGTNVFAVLFFVWALASVPVVTAMMPFTTVDADGNSITTAMTIDLDFVFLALKATLASVGYYFFMSAGLGQVLAGSPEK